MVICGIDLGTAVIKVVFLNEAGGMLWSKAVSAVAESAVTCEGLLTEGLSSLGLSRNNLINIATTGYGKRVFSNSVRIVDEITAIGTGAYFLSSGTARTIVNIGGQDVKAIKLDPSGKVADFKMNDKCGAGTGRFLEKISAMLDVSIGEFCNTLKGGGPVININNTCGIFIESEIVSLLYNNIEKSSIVYGITRSIAKRLADLVRGIGVEQELYLDGGPAQGKGLVAAFEDEVMVNVKTFPYPQFTAATGAAVLLLKEKGGCL